MSVKENLKKFFEFVLKLTETSFYGKLVVSFEKGIIVNIRREENIKVADLYAKERIFK